MDYYKLKINFCQNNHYVMYVMYFHENFATEDLSSIETQGLMESEDYLPNCICYKSTKPRDKCIMGIIKGLDRLQSICHPDEPRD